MTTARANEGRAARVAKTNTILAICTLAAIALSAFAYNDSVRRAERFERGQNFLPNLNPDEVAMIELEKGDERVAMRREDDRFVVMSEGRYPAANESVNRLLRDMLDLSLEKEIGRGEALATELGLGDDGANLLDVALQDAAGKSMVRFRVGDGLETGGSYVVRTDEGAEKTIYLTSGRVFLNTDGGSYLEKDIVDQQSSSIVTINGPDYALARREGASDLELEGLADGSTSDRTKVDQLGSLLSGLRFNEHHQADAPQVAGLLFEAPVEVVLEDGSGYRLEVAAKDDKQYLRIEGYHTAGRIEVTVDASEDEVRETSEVLVRADEISAFNQLHGSWIYEIPSFTADKLRLRRKDFLGSP